jgi:predicted enzyme related to lactoylglutathione lyase
MTSGTQTVVGRFVWHDHASGDRDRAKTFYAELLGWEIEIFKPGEMDYPMISANGQQHGGFGPAQGGAPSHWLGHVVVEDVEAAMQRAKGAGGEIVTGPMEIPEVGRIAVIRDPQGAVISAFEPQGEARIPEGAFLWDELRTSDLDGAKRFYGEVFGWTAGDVEVEGQSYTLFQLGETSVAGCSTAAGEGTPPHWAPYLATDDVDASTAKAKELGATVYLEPTSMQGVGRFSALGDPTGAPFGLMKPE